MVNDSATPASDPSGPRVPSDAARALAEGRFFLVYQPTIDLHTNGFAGVEALIRRRDPEGATAGPDAFLAEIESSGDIIEIGRWALAMACHQGALWHAKGYRFTVSVNVSPSQFLHHGFTNDVADALRTSRFDPALLILEFAQRTLLDAPDAAQRLGALDALGVGVAVDDFDLAHSSLDALAGLPLASVKISRSSIAAAHGADLAERVHDLVVEARPRHLQIVASGVEDADQRRLLQREDVGLGQGFLFSRPHEAPEIDRLLEDFALFSGKPL